MVVNLYKFNNNVDAFPIVSNAKKENMMLPYSKMRGKPLLSLLKSFPY